MATVNDMAREFLSQKRLAVVGISGTREVTGNNLYKLLRQRGHEVYAISPHLDTFDGDPCYPELAALPIVPDGVVIVTRPEVTLEVVKQCVDVGVKRVWMHDMRGTQPKFAKESGQALTSVSDEAVRLCREHGVMVIPGGCPRQFDGDFGHKCMRWMLHVMGALEVAEEKIPAP
jgi:predicted CoA-binding protein